MIDTSRGLSEAGGPEAPEEARYYHVDPSWFEENALSFDDVVRARMCDTCRAKNYVHRDMPTLEAIFRIFLANGNQAMTLEQVREQLAEWCPGGGCQWLLLPIETVERLVQNDTYYGLRQVEPPGAA